MLRRTRSSRLAAVCSLADVPEHERCGNCLSLAPQPPATSRDPNDPSAAIAARSCRAAVFTVLPSPIAAAAGAPESGHPMTKAFDVFELPVHQAAAVFPMLKPDELDDLAADIRTHGQHEPIVVLIDSDGRRSILDGQNRREACKRAGVAPRVVTLTAADVPDPAAYVAQRNLQRRHLLKGQRAMVAACLFPIGKPGPAGPSSPRNLGVSPELLRQARRVLERRPDMAPAIIAGTEHLGHVFASLDREAAQKAHEASTVPAGQSRIERTRRAARGEAPTSPSSPPLRPSQRAERSASSPLSSPRPPDPPRRKTGSSERPASLRQPAPRSDYDRAVHAFLVLATIKADPERLARDHGSPRRWPKYIIARELIAALERAAEKLDE